MAYEYIKIIKKGDIYKIWNTVYKIFVGEIRRERMGQWMHWQLFQYGNVGFTNGCLKEISHFITKLYGKQKHEWNGDQCSCGYNAREHVNAYPFI